MKYYLAVHIMFVSVNAVTAYLPLVRRAKTPWQIVSVPEVWIDYGFGTTERVDYNARSQMFDEQKKLKEFLEKSAFQIVNRESQTTFDPMTLNEVIPRSTVPEEHTESSKEARKKLTNTLRQLFRKIFKNNDTNSV